MHIAVMALPFVQSCYLILGALYLFVPIMGRSGGGNNSELMIAVMVSVLHTLLFAFAAPLIVVVRGVGRIFTFLWGLFLLSVAVLLLTPVGFPYSGTSNNLAPQRFMIAVSTSFAVDLFVVRKYLQVFALIVAKFHHTFLIFYKVL